MPICILYEVVELSAFINISLFNIFDSSQFEELWYVNSNMF